MAISILPCTVADVRSTIDLGTVAFADNPLSLALNVVTPEQAEEFKQWRAGMSTLRMSGPGKHYFKAVDDETGKVVGFTGMYDPERARHAWDGDGPQAEAFKEVAGRMPKFMNAAAEDEFRSKQKAAMQKFVGDRKDMWYVQSMAVDPSQQGKGIAGKLMRRALEEVDKAGQDVYLEATPPARRLYESCGFEVVEELPCFDGTFIMTAMLRQAPARKSETGE